MEWDVFETPRFLIDCSRRAVPYFLILIVAGRNGAWTDGMGKVRVAPES